MNFKDKIYLAMNSVRIDLAKRDYSSQEKVKVELDFLKAMPFPRWNRGNDNNYPKCEYYQAWTEILSDFLYYIGVRDTPIPFGFISHYTFEGWDGTRYFYLDFKQSFRAFDIRSFNRPDRFFYIALKRITLEERHQCKCYINPVAKPQITLESEYEQLNIFDKRPSKDAVILGGVARIPQDACTLSKPMFEKFYTSGQLKRL